MIYLDNASTSYPKPNELYKAINEYGKHIGASPNRAMYSLAKKAEILVESTREQFAELFNLSNPNHLCFTLNATHSLNIAIKGILKKNDHVIITSFEHNATFRPIFTATERGTISYDILESDKDGIFRLECLETLIKCNTRLIICNHASNVIGVISPIKEIGYIAKKNKIPFLVDCAQTAGLLDIDVKEACIDILAGTGHKSLLGPSGVGFLYLRDPELVNTLIEGGSGQNSLSPRHPKNMPHKFEAGTLNYLGITGLNASLKYIKK